MLPDDIARLIREEQARQAGRFVAGVDLEAYLAKLAKQAEIVSDDVGGRCRGFVAFYCNDAATRQAYITLVLVEPGHRGQGIGRTLVARVLDLARSRGFTSCRLEVEGTNTAARAMYEDLGFRIVESRGPKDLLAIAF